MFCYSVGNFAMKPDKVALAVLVTAVYIYKWCIKYRAIDVPDPSILLHVYGGCHPRYQTNAGIS
jgi:hypothetical protein